MRKLVVITLLAMLLIPTATVATSSPQAVGVSGRALLLQSLLKNLLTLNISSELRAEIEELINTNVSKLSIEELEKFVRKCEEVLIRVREEVGMRTDQDVGNTYCEGLRNSLEARMRVIERLYSVSFDEVNNISRAKNLTELVDTLRVVNNRLDSVRVKNFFETMEERVENTLRRPDVVGVEKSIQELDKAVGVLSRVISRLEGLKVPAIPVEALKNAIDRILITKEILENVNERLRGVPHPKPEVLRELINKSVSVYSSNVEELKDEIEELRNIAIEQNLTQVLDTVGNLLERLNNLTTTIQRVNYSSIKEVAEVLTSVKTEVFRIRKEVKDSLREVPVRNIDKAFNVVLGRARELLKTVNKSLEYVEDMLSGICSQLTNITVCRLVNLMTIQHYNEILNSLNKSLEEAVNAYESEDRINALHTVTGVIANLSRVKAWLEPIYNILKRLDVKDMDIVDAVNSLLENMFTRLENITKGLESIMRRVREMGEDPRKGVVKKLLDDVVRDVNESKRLLTYTQKLVSEGRDVEVSPYLSRVQALITSLEVKIMMLEKLTS